MSKRCELITLQFKSAPPRIFHTQRFSGARQAIRPSPFLTWSQQKRWRWKKKENTGSCASRCAGAPGGSCPKYPGWFESDTLMRALSAAMAWERAGLRMDGLPAADSWDVVIEVLRPAPDLWDVASGVPHSSNTNTPTNQKNSANKGRVKELRETAASTQNVKLR